MAIIQSGASTDLMTVESTHKAARETPRPTDHGALGHYAWSGATGVLPAALAGNSEVFQFRWSDATRYALIRGVWLSACVSTTFFAAGIPGQIELVKCTTWTVAGTLGAAINMAATGKKRTLGMGNSVMVAGDARIAAAVALGAGTKVIEANSISNFVYYCPAAAPGQMINPRTPIYLSDMGDGDHPLVLQQNEGFIIRSVAVPATGTWQLTVAVEWAELAAF